MGLIGICGVVRCDGANHTQRNYKYYICFIVFLHLSEGGLTAFDTAHRRPKCPPLGIKGVYTCKFKQRVCP